MFLKLYLEKRKLFDGLVLLMELWFMYYEP